MKLFYVLFLSVCLMGCKQLQHGQMQPIKLLDAKHNIYFTTCSGAVEDRSSCINKAKATCKQGYSIISYHETPAQGARRDLTFQCVN